jgi:hypothetical protein
LFLPSFWVSILFLGQCGASIPWTPLASKPKTCYVRFDFSCSFLSQLIFMWATEIPVLNVGWLCTASLYPRCSWYSVKYSYFRCRRLEEATDQSLMFEVDRNRKLEAQVFKVMPLPAHFREGIEKIHSKGVSHP